MGWVQRLGGDGLAARVVFFHCSSEWSTQTKEQKHVRPGNGARYSQSHRVEDIHVS